MTDQLVAPKAHERWPEKLGTSRDSLAFRASSTTGGVTSSRNALHQKGWPTCMPRPPAWQLPHCRTSWWDGTGQSSALPWCCTQMTTVLSCCSLLGGIQHWATLGQAHATRQDEEEEVRYSKDRIVGKIAKRPRDFDHFGQVFLPPCSMTSPPAPPQQRAQNWDITAGLHAPGESTTKGQEERS